ncbi:MAG: hypothetical protein ACE145_08725 [Terriglobia bacterium]
MTRVQTRLLKAFLISCAVELPMFLLLVVPRNPHMEILAWHAFPYYVVGYLADWLDLSTPVFVAGLFIGQTVLLTPFVYVVLRVWPWVARKWTEWTDDFLR